MSTEAYVLGAALRRAYNLGKVYWQQADSEDTSQHRKADETQAKFDALLSETVAALAQPVAASDVQVPNTFKLPGESDEAWVGRITWPAGTPEPVFVYSGQSGRELEDLLEGYDFGTAFYTSPPAAQPVAAEPSIEDLCARIKAADDAAADNDYMLDSDDCIRVLRGTWKGPLAMDKPDPPTPA